MNGGNESVSVPTPATLVPRPRAKPARPKPRPAVTHSGRPDPWADPLNQEQLVAAVIRLGQDQTYPITTAEVIIDVVRLQDHHSDSPVLLPVTDARAVELAAMPYPEYLRTPEWQQRRGIILKHAEYRCQVCNRGRELHVHHRTYERRGNEHTADLIALCDECHALFHGKTPKAV